MLKTVTSSLLSLTGLALTSLNGQRLQVLNPPRSLLTGSGEYIRELVLCDVRLMHFISYPVLIRPSYVLSGAAMNVVFEESALEHNLSAAASVSPLHPVVVTKFIDGAQEIDVDAVAYEGKLLIHAVSEHVENAGVHSGDATLVLPPHSLTPTDLARLKNIAEKVAAGFEISGPFNMQIIKKPAKSSDEEPQLKVIECNLRASRSFPFVSKVLGRNFIEVATSAITGQDVPEPVDLMEQKRDYTAIKVAQFSWTRLGGADPFLGVGEPLYGIKNTMSLICE